MSLPLWLLALALAQQPDGKSSQAAPAPEPPEEQNPPEEDERLAPKEYSFNPLQAAKELRIGDYYMKRGKYKAASMRYSEAAKWNPQSAEAFRKLGEAEEKQEDSKAAREAFQKALEIDSNSKDANEIRKKLAKLK